MLSNLDLIRRVPLFSMLTANQAESAIPIGGQASLPPRRNHRRAREKINALYIPAERAVPVVVT